MDSPPQTNDHDQEDQAPEPIAGSPSDFLKNIVGKKVKVRIGSGVDYHGMFPYFISTFFLKLSIFL